jgi:hypothetical protein
LDVVGAAFGISGCGNAFDRHGGGLAVKDAIQESAHLRRRGVRFKALLTAIESTPHTAIVYTLAVRSDGKGTDAFAEENEFLARAMSELESVSGSKATNLNLTRDDETSKVIRRRLFASIDDSRASEVIRAHRELWTSHRDILSEEARRSTTSAEFAQTYPFHPVNSGAISGHRGGEISGHCCRR